MENSILEKDNSNSTIVNEEDNSKEDHLIGDDHLVAGDNIAQNAHLHVNLGVSDVGTKTILIPGNHNPNRIEELCGENQINMEIST